MLTTPKSLRLHIAITGRSNSGKSSLLNHICGSSSSITSPEKGTTTDVVEKAMEFRPIGPVLLLDTAGTDDDTTLGAQRIERTRKAIEKADILLIVTRSNVWGTPENDLLKAAKEKKIPAIPIVTHTDKEPVKDGFISEISNLCGSQAICVCPLPDSGTRDEFLNALRLELLKVLSEEFITPPPLLADLVPESSTVLLLVPIDSQAPKGRLILPQVQAIREILDANASAVIANENNFAAQLQNLKTPPALVICDSQVVHIMVKHLPPEIPATTFSILFARLKGDLELLAEGAKAIDLLEDGDCILISEACTHHAADDDIGRVKIPRLIEKKTGKKLLFDVISRDFPDDLAKYKLVIHCGSCMLNRKETLSRINFANSCGIPVTNFGMAISHCQGVLERALSPFRSIK